MLPDPNQRPLSSVSDVTNATGAWVQRHITARLTHCLGLVPPTEATHYDVKPNTRPVVHTQLSEHQICDDSVSETDFTRRTAGLLMYLLAWTAR